MSARLRPYWRAGRVGRVDRAQAYAETMQVTGSLYGAGYDESERFWIREACEELGLPMGYGRVHATPECIDPEELPPLFRNVSHR